MQTDRIFNDSKIGIGEFRFDDAVADVFDDMIARSVPLYGEVQRLIPVLASTIDHDPLRIVDLGCSTGTSLIHLARSLPDRRVELTGVDSSASMLAKCRERLKKFNLNCAVKLVEEDLLEYEIREASMVLLNYTLQFVAPPLRQELLAQIRTGLQPGGLVVVSEKVCHDQSHMDEQLTDLYVEFKKRNGYSELEIARKRNALENVLVPLTLDNNLQLLQEAGFERMEIMLKWFNFATMAAWK